jgi:hypothetical protein
MTSEALKEVYETPRACVRGVFLCENVAGTEVSALTGAITQEAWAAGDEPVGAGTNPDGDIGILF